MADKLDDKVHGILVRDKNGAMIPPDEYVVFRPQDNAFPATLLFYRDECIRLGCDAAQIKALDNLIERVTKWRADHPERLKLADVEPGECRDIPAELHGKSMIDCGDEQAVLHAFTHAMISRCQQPRTLAEAEQFCNDTLRKIKDFRDGKGVKLEDALSQVGKAEECVVYLSGKFWDWLRRERGSATADSLAGLVVGVLHRGDSRFKLSFPSLSLADARKLALNCDRQVAGDTVCFVIDGKPEDFDLIKAVDASRGTTEPVRP